MKNFGKNLKIEPKKKGLSEKELFIDIINVFDECNQRTEDLEETYMMGISNYDEAFYLMIENLLYIHYGEWKTDIILWWVYDRFGPEGEIMPIELNDHDTNSKESVVVETAEQLWSFLKRIDKLESK
jgi:hypothetical protein